MFNRTLQRPMFRIGGSAGTGITSGLRRQGYKGTDDPGDQRVKMASDFEVMKEAIGERPKGDPYPTAEKYPYKASDFFMGLGQGILAQPGGQPILQVVGKAANLPLQNLTKAQMADWEVSQQNKLNKWKTDRENELGQWSSDKDLMMAAYKNMSQDDKNKLWTEAGAMFENKGTNPYTKQPFKSQQEAYNLLLKQKFMSKEKVYTPEAQYNDSYDKFLNKHLGNLNFKGNSVAASNLAKHEANIIHGKYPKEVVDQFNLTQLWIDPTFYDEKDGVKTLNDIGEIAALGIETGKIYMNVADGNFYKLGPNKIFEQVSLTDLQG